MTNLNEDLVRHIMFVEFAELWEIYENIGPIESTWNKNNTMKFNTHTHTHRSIQNVRYVCMQPCILVNWNMFIKITSFKKISELYSNKNWSCFHQNETYEEIVSNDTVRHPCINAKNPEHGLGDLHLYKQINSIKVKNSTDIHQILSLSFYYMLSLSYISFCFSFYTGYVLFL